MLRLILGRAGSGKTSYIMNEIKKRGESGEKRLYLLVPEQYSHSAERQLCSVCGGALSLYGEVLSFSRLSTRVFAETGGTSERAIGRAGRLLVMSRALETALPDLRVYCRRTGNAAFAEKLVETASEFKNACITVADIREAAAKAEYPLNEKLGDLALICDIYWSLFDVSRLDPDDILTKTVEAISDGSFAGGAAIWFDGFADFSVQQLDVICALLAAGAEVSVCLTCDGLSDDSEVFAITRSTAAQLIAHAKKRGIAYSVKTRDPAPGTKPHCFSELEEMLASGRAADAETHCGGAISIMRAKSPEEECELAASQALRLVRSGYRWQDISVVTGSWEQYRSVGRSVFAKYGVPVYMNEKTDILTLAPAALISSALFTVISGWEYTHIFRCLKTGLCGIAPEECDLLENYALKWGIRGSLWYGDGDWTFSPEGYNAAVSDEDVRLLERINAIRRKVVPPLVRLQDALSCADTVSAMLAAMYAYLEDISLPELLAAKAAEFLASDRRQLSDMYEQVWDTVIDAMEQFNEVAGDMCYDLSEFVRLWELALSQYDIGTIPVALDMLGFGDIERLRRRGTKCLIVLGATDDSLPRLSGAPGVFSDFERDALIRAGFRLKMSSSARITSDLFALYSSLTLPSDKLIMTYPSADASGADKRPAPVLSRIEELFGLGAEDVDISECRLTARIPCFECAISEAGGGKNAFIASRLCEGDGTLSEKLALARASAAMKRGTMTPESARRLYGGDIHMTASRVDRYYSCRYSYFLKYGLKVKPRKKAELDPSIIGTFMHYVLENVTREARSLGGFRAVSDEKCTELTGKYVSQYAEETLRGLDDKTGRFRYLFRKLAADAEQVVLEMAGELRRSDFQPLDFELDFSASGELPPPELTDGETRVEVSGFVDRVDGWVHDGRLYLRVIDYKTGKKSFSLSEVWNGIGLQMLIYLFALGKSGALRYGREIVPAGVLYVPARDVLISAKRNATDAEIAKKRAQSIARSGLILDDPELIEAMENGGEKRYIPVRINKGGTFSGDSLVTAEQLGRLSAHIDALLLQVGRELRSGYLAADPYYRSQLEDACRVCDYRQACGFGECPGDAKKHVTRLKTPEVWDLLKKEAAK